MVSKYQFKHSKKNNLIKSIVKWKNWGEHDWYESLIGEHNILELVSYVYKLNIMFKYQNIIL